MAFDGTWKVDRNENYEKFMEALGKAHLSNPFCRENATPNEYKPKLSKNYLQAILSFHSWLLCPCIYFQNILRWGEDAEKCSDFNYTELLLSI